MPILIAHRGLLNGPNRSMENTINSLEFARAQGYDIEVDLWVVDGQWMLGHDEPAHTISDDQMRTLDRKDIYDDHHMWIHAKNIDALYQLRKIRWPGHFFYHQQDDAVLTSTGYFWTQPGRQLTPLSVCVMPELTMSLRSCKDIDVYAFCTDHALAIKTSTVNPYLP